jgi:hypothetical protein
MKNAIFIPLLFVATAIFAQQNFNDSIAISRTRLTQHAMVTLGSFAAANIATGFIAANNNSGEARYFWQMNAYWNFFNLGIAGLGYIGTFKALDRKYSFADNYKAQKSIERLYMVNFGLDIVYITGGILLRAKGNSETTAHLQDQFKGYGTSIIAQGSFLLLMDGVMVMLHHKNTLRLGDRMKNVAINVGVGAMAVSYAFYCNTATRVTMPFKTVYFQKWRNRHTCGGRYLPKLSMHG